MDEEITHKEIYERLVCVEDKIDRIDENTKEVTAAFSAAKGAFIALEVLGKIAKPILWITGVCSAIAVLWNEFWKR
ncbi:hypothetical protein [Zwartia sp.]|uniref:hypothetical protein n=1 Tax=Zwartia sp. TaxID=2978004 RepID=UPI003C774697